MCVKRKRWIFGSTFVYAQPSKTNTGEVAPEAADEEGGAVNAEVEQRKEDPPVMNKGSSFGNAHMCCVFCFLQSESRVALESIYHTFSRNDVCV